MKDGRAKGNAYMRDIARILSYWLDPKLPPKVRAEDLPIRVRETHRQPIDGTWKVKGDLWVHPKLLFPFAVECKKQEAWDLDGYTNPKWPVWDWWQQAVSQAAANTAPSWPLLIFSRNRRPNYVILDTVHAGWLDLRPKTGPMLRIERPGEQSLTMVLLDDLVALPHDVLKTLIAS